jgi:hypothetical protein
MPAMMALSGQLPSLSQTLPTTSTFLPVRPVFQAVGAPTILLLSSSRTLALPSSQSLLTWSDSRAGRLRDRIGHTDRDTHHACERGEHPPPDRLVQRILLRCPALHRNLTVRHLT